MSTVTTSIGINGDVQITWAQPNDNSDPITAYKIEIQLLNGSWLQDTTDCNGSSSIIMSQMYCVVPMSTLTSTYSLVFGDLVVARASAYNVNGWGLPSIPNTSGATIRQIPVQMADPTRGSLTS